MKYRLSHLLRYFLYIFACIREYIIVFHRSSSLGIYRGTGTGIVHRKLAKGMREKKFMILSLFRPPQTKSSPIFPFTMEENVV